MFTVRLELEVDDALDDARPHWRRLDDAWNIIEWALARDPTCGAPLTEGGLARSFVFEGAWAHEMPTLQVIYVFDGEVIGIKSVRISDPKHAGGTA